MSSYVGSPVILVACAMKPEWDSSTMVGLIVYICMLLYLSNWACQRVLSVCEKGNTDLLFTNLC
jgi:hypothetical protein